MLKYLVFVIAVHVLAWGGTHWYLSGHPERILIVVDSSYEMRNQGPRVTEWVEKFSATRRYVQVHVGTDKADLGPLSELSSPAALTRSTFGRFDAQRVLTMYGHADFDEKIILSNQPLAMDGFETKLMQ